MSSLADVFEGRARWSVALCDCRFGMSAMPAESVDAIVCDPPYGLGFMGKEWDTFSPKETARRLKSKARKAIDAPIGQHGRPGELARAGIEYDRSLASNWRFQDWCREWAQEALRVAKPGAYLLAFGGTRTWHRLASAIEDAGWELRDSIAWMHASGFPKSLDISKAIDAKLGADRAPDEYTGPNGKNGVYGKNMGGGVTLRRSDPCTAAAAAAGFGTALKPAFEPVVVARKPLSGTVAETWLAHGTGGLNIDACRIACSPEDFAELAAGVEAIRARGGSMGNSWKNTSDLSGANPASPLGRWPANVVLSHAEGCIRRGGELVARKIMGASTAPGRVSPFAGGGLDGRRAEVAEVAEVWDCAPGCPVKELDEQSGIRPGMSGGGAHAESYGGGMFGAIDSTGTARGDTGGASRFFFCAKAARSERDSGLEEFAIASGAERTERKEGSAGITARAGATGSARNTHPTVKPVDLMRWLVRLVTPRGGLVLDPFCGSGTTGVAAMLEGFRFVGLEMEPLHVDFSRARIAHVVGGDWKREVPEKRVAPKQPSLFSPDVTARNGGGR